MSLGILIDVVETANVMHPAFFVPHECYWHQIVGNEKVDYLFFY